MPRVLSRIGGYEVGDGRPLLLIAGPCVMEDAAHALAHARKVKALAAKHAPVVSMTTGASHARRIRSPLTERGSSPHRR